MKFSILTATYNRAHTLPRLYESLVRNKDNDLEWLIMDDGSTDKTKKLIDKFVKDKKIKIKYFFQENQGKMTAINNLIEHSTGKYIIEIDSDDYFTNDAFKRINSHIEDLEQNDNLGALVFHMYAPDSNPFGKSISPDGFITSIFDLIMKRGATGEANLVFKGDIRKKYSYKMEQKENFSPETRMYFQIDKKYSVLYYDEAIVVGEYQSDGYTKNISKLQKNNPQTYYNYFREMFDLNLKGLPFKKRIYIIKNYIQFSYLVQKSRLEVINDTKGRINTFLVIIMLIPIYIRTKKKKTL